MKEDEKKAIKAKSDENQKEIEIQVLIDVKDDVDYPEDDALWDSYGDPLSFPFTDVYDDVNINYLKDDNNKLTGFSLAIKTQLTFPKPENENVFYQEIFDNLLIAIEEVEKKENLTLSITDISMYQKIELKNLEKEMQKYISAHPIKEK